MTTGYQDITQDLELGEGGILAAWFIAELTGPVAISIGFLQRDEQRDIFYAWHHWSGCKAYRIGTASRNLDQAHPSWGEYVFHDLVRMRNAGLTAHPHDYGFFQDLPSILLLNGNPAIKEAMVDVATAMNAGRDWRKELFLLNRFGPDLFSRARWIVRDKLEYARSLGHADADMIARVEKQFAKAKGFVDWALPDLPSSFTTRELVAQWADLISAPDYLATALWRIAQMWVGAPKHCNQQALERSREEGRHISFDRLAEFFAQYGLTPWTASFNDFSLQLELALNR